MARLTAQPTPGSTSPRLEQPTNLGDLPSGRGDSTRVVRPADEARGSDAPPRKAGSLKLPSVGDALFGFTLRHELGRGSFARVFLAEQADLAGRPVALKVSAIAGTEPQTLAQLQHTNIVPIYSVHDDASLGLRAVCMPYFGGASLSAVLQVLFKETTCPQRGADLVRALRAMGSPAVMPTRTVPVHDLETKSDDGLLAELDRQTYVQAVAWIVLHLAEGIHHAHQRGVLHRDVKPSNVLLCGDGLPMLLDFNVAQEVSSLQTQAKVILGGTVAYMAPEQLHAIAERNIELARKVGRQADIYSLGMVLYEMIAGCNPFDFSGSYSPMASQLEVMAKERSHAIPSLRQHRADIPWSLESIARMCLAPDPAQRYQCGEHLAEDLRRFLTDQPLKHAPELSWVERGQKWLRRHPRLTSSAAVAAVAGVLLVGAGATLIAVQNHLTQTRAALHLQQVQDKKRAFEQGTTKALCLVNTLVNVQGHLPEGIKVCEATLNIFGVLACDDWQDSPDWLALTTDERRRLAEDTRELLLLLGAARLRAASPDEAVLRDALNLLDRAEKIHELGESRALWDARADYLARLGEVEASAVARARAQSLQPTSAREHYLLAAAYLRGERTREARLRAIAALDAAIQLDDRYYWAYVQRGICSYEVEDYTAAARDFGICVGLWPEFAYGHYNLGYVLDRCGSKAAALAAYSVALERDPAFVMAYVSRGLLHLDAKRYEAALTDLHQAQELGQDDAALHAGRGAALEALGRAAEADDAFRTAAARLEKATAEVRTHVHLLHGFTVAKRQPAHARAAFAAVPARDPRYSQALYGLALVETEQGRPRDALRAFDRALEVHPEFTEARRFRAVVRAREGDLQGASQDVNLCLDREPKNGATLYAAACVAALAWEKTLDPAACQQAFFFLEKALKHQYGLAQANHDPDLASLRKDARFQQLLAKP